MERLLLEPGEIDSIRDLLSAISGEVESVEDEAFQRHAAVYAHELPRRVRRHLYDFKQDEPRSALCMISGYPIEQAKLGPTPEHWKVKSRRTFEEEALLVLFGSLLGECIGWSTQQEGCVVHDILPIRGHEGEQLGSGSEQLLWWHTEDAFHPYRGDYLGMLCLRNPDHIATTFLSLEGLPLPAAQVDLLFEPHFTIRPDESHLVKNKANPGRVEEERADSYAGIERMQSAPDKVAILSGDRESPYIRIDPYFMDPVTDNAAAQEAFEALVRYIDTAIEDLVFEVGDYCFIDNFKAVHGRKPFKARYDGQDRWLKRINVTRDLRKSRTSRQSAASRIIC